MVPLVVPHQKVRSPWKGTRCDGPVNCSQTSLFLPLQPALQWVDLSERTLCWAEFLSVFSLF